MYVVGQPTLPLYREHLRQLTTVKIGLIEKESPRPKEGAYVVAG